MKGIRKYNKHKMKKLDNFFNLLNFYTSLFGCSFYYKVLLKFAKDFNKLVFKHIKFLSKFLDILHNINKIFLLAYNYKALSKIYKFYLLFNLYYKFKQNFINFDIRKNNSIILNNYIYKNKINKNIYNYFNQNKSLYKTKIIKLIVFNMLIYLYFLSLFILWFNGLFLNRILFKNFKYKILYFNKNKVKLKDQYYIERFNPNKFYLFYKNYIYSYII